VRRDVLQYSPILRFKSDVEVLTADVAMPSFLTKQDIAKPLITYKYKATRSIESEADAVGMLQPVDGNVFTTVKVDFL
jgi:hypothetical protein